MIKTEDYLFHIARELVVLEAQNIAVIRLLLAKGIFTNEEMTAMYEKALVESEDRYNKALEEIKEQS